MRTKRIGSGLFAGWVLIASAVAGSGQAPATQPAADKIACSGDRSAPSEADKALWKGNYADAERQYGSASTADPSSSDAQAGLVRAMLGDGKLQEALALALKSNAAHPNDPQLLDALGEARFRRGEVRDAGLAFNQSLQLDMCNGVSHFDVSQYYALSGMSGSAQRQLDMAHTLSPMNREIQRRWRSAHAVPPTDEQRLARLQQRLQSPTLSDEDKQDLQAAIKGVQSHEKGSCELVSPLTEVKLPMVPIANEVGLTAQDIHAVGLDVQLNGKRKRLEIDTGASGLLLSRSAAKSAGLIPELEIETGGIGDQGAANSFVTHVDDIRMGSMEFKNCRVQVLEKTSALDVDGLIGPDVFRDYLVTLDIPGRELRIGPLPKRPDEQASQPTALNTAEEQAGPLSSADSARDRYVAPEMKDWMRVFRAGHMLIVPTTIGDTPAKLFLMDTGSSISMISPSAAREVTHVSGDQDIMVKGIGGQVNHVLLADRVSITFAGVTQITNGMASFDGAAIGRSAGVEVSGVIGFPTLRELVISIDYRDNLIHVVYDPKKGFHYR